MSHTLLLSKQLTSALAQPHTTSGAAEGGAAGEEPTGTQQQLAARLDEGSGRWVLCGSSALDAKGAPILP